MTRSSIRRWWTDDRGGVVDYAVIFPFVLMLTLAIIQVALYFHARNIATGASETALRFAASQGGNAPAGTAAAYTFIATAGGTALQAPIVTTTRTAYTASCAIQGKSISLVPWVTFIVNVNQSRPVERVTYPGTT